MVQKKRYDADANITEKEKKRDEALEQSFPASDPPSHSPGNNSRK